MAGVIRRATVVDHDLSIRPTRLHRGRASGAWLYGMSLRGRISFVPGFRSRKGIHGANAGAAWRLTPRDDWSYFRTALSYLAASGIGRWRVAVAIPGLAVATLAIYPLTRLGNRFTSRGRAFRKEHRAAE